MFYSYFAALGYDIAVEESSSRGRLDMAVRTAGHVYLFEFKVAEMAPPGSALAQLQERRYADKYRASGEAMRRERCLYVDKTRFLHELENARYAFLIRPRRFGKSCWVSLLENYYDRNAADRFEALFAGTEIGRQPTANRRTATVTSSCASTFRRSTTRWRPCESGSRPTVSSCCVTRWRPTRTCSPRR